MNFETVFFAIDEMNDRYCDLWEQACNVESPTSYKEGVDAVGDIFIELAKKQNWLVEVLELEKAGNAICITINPDAKEKPVVFSGHIDTVHPIGLFGTPAVRKDETCIYGPGVMDCKGGVVASMMALEALNRCGFDKRPVKLIIQTDEETSSKTSNQQTISFMVEKAGDAVAFLNTEGIQDDTAVLVRKGILRYAFAVHGKAMHSSKCMYGANAVAEAAHKILKLETMKDIDGLSCNCGVINGGSVPNSVAEECEFSADIRFVDRQQLEEAIAFCEEVANNSTIEGCSCTATKISVRPAMPLCDANVELLDKMNELPENA